MRQIIRKSAIPVYAVAACWLLYALVFPLYKFWHFILVALISVGAYFLFSRLFPARTIEVEEPIKPVSSGEKDVDQLIREGYQTLEEMRSLNVAIEGEKISTQIVQLESLARKIFDFIGKNPQKAPRVRKFMNYYLPTTMKLLRSYDGLESQGVDGKNIRESMHKIETIMDTIVIAFASQLDHLFSDEALDISTDIVVLEGMMAKEGLTGSDFDTIKNPSP